MGDQAWLCEALAPGSGNPVSGALLSPAAAGQWAVCPKGGCTERAGTAGLRDLSSEELKAPCCAPDPSDVVWPTLAITEGGKSVTRSGSATSLPKPHPSLHPPCPNMKQDYDREKVPEAPLAQTNCSQESPSRSVCLFYKLSPTDASRGRLNFLFFLNVCFFF